MKLTIIGLILVLIGCGVLNTCVKNGSTEIKNVDGWIGIGKIYSGGVNAEVYKLIDKDTGNLVYVTLSYRGVGMFVVEKK